ncbi:MAG TPA: Rossmann-like and DUF2520 domain-containing protein [Gemmatimonadaceae bacterium]|jgi:predicted short-subunit dehydrogenase-like oxidoreductase (DUF2520 family)
MSERVFVLGAGRAGRGLARALRAVGVEVVGLHGRQRVDAADDISIGTLPPSAGAASVILVTVRDAQLESVLRDLASERLQASAVVLHASGSADPAAMALLRQRGHPAGTFHPLIPLVDPTRAAATLRGAWIGIDGDAEARMRARALAAQLGAKTLEIPAGQKPRYHAAAVLVSNFPAVLLALGERVLAEAGLGPETARHALLPLWLAAVDNVRGATTVATALTGPVVRGDAVTVRANLDALRDDETARTVYRVLSLALLEVVGEDGRVDVRRALDQR